MILPKLNFLTFSISALEMKIVCMVKKQTTISVVKGQNSLNHCIQENDVLRDEIMSKPISL